jgi:hypothetical protein
MLIQYVRSQSSMPAKDLPLTAMSHMTHQDLCDARTSVALSALLALLSETSESAQVFATDAASSALSDIVAMTLHETWYLCFLCHI